MIPYEFDGNLMLFSNDDEVLRLAVSSNQLTQWDKNKGYFEIQDPSEEPMKEISENEDIQPTKMVKVKFSQITIVSDETGIEYRELTNVTVCSTVKAIEPLLNRWSTNYKYCIHRLVQRNLVKLLD